MKPLCLFVLTACAGLTANTTGTFTGVITDTMCKKDHAMMKVSPDAKCVNECVRTNEGKYALFDGTNLYPLSDQRTPARFAGKKVKIVGTLHGKTNIIEVGTIQVDK